MNGNAALLLGSYILAMAGANFSVVQASRATGVRAFIWFALANVIGFLCPLVMTFALKQARPMVAYAIGIGGGYCVLQLVNYYFFEQGLSAAQWLGTILVCAGVVLLQIKAV